MSFELLKTDEFDDGTDLFTKYDGNGWSLFVSLSNDDLIVSGTGPYRIWKIESSTTKTHEPFVFIKPDMNAQNISDRTINLVTKTLHEASELFDAIKRLGFEFRDTAKDGRQMTMPDKIVTL